MYTDFFIEDETKRERQKLLKAGRFVLWVLMIGISIFFASQSLALTG